MGTGFALFIFAAKFGLGGTEEHTRNACLFRAEIQLKKVKQNNCFTPLGPSTTLMQLWSIWSRSSPTRRNFQFDSQVWVRTGPCPIRFSSRFTDSPQKGDRSFESTGNRGFIERWGIDGLKASSNSMERCKLRPIAQLTIGRKQRSKARKQNACHQYLRVISREASLAKQTYQRLFGDPA